MAAPAPYRRQNLSTPELVCLERGGGEAGGEGEGRDELRMQHSVKSFIKITAAKNTGVRFLVAKGTDEG